MLLFPLLFLAVLFLAVLFFAVLFFAAVFFAAVFFALLVRDVPGRTAFKARFAAGTAALAVRTTARVPASGMRGLFSFARVPSTPPMTPPTIAPTGPAIAPSTAPVAAPAVGLETGGMSMLRSDDDLEVCDFLAIGVTDLGFYAVRLRLQPTSLNSWLDLRPVVLCLTKKRPQLQLPHRSRLAFRKKRQWDGSEDQQNACETPRRSD